MNNLRKLFGMTDRMTMLHNSLMSINYTIQQHQKYEVLVISVKR